MVLTLLSLTTLGFFLLCMYKYQLLKIPWFPGSTQPAQPATGGLFGTPQSTASTGFGGGFGATSSFGGATSAFKPAGGFGTSTGGFGGAGATTAGGMFGTTASQPNQSFSGFGTNTLTSSTTFGQTQGAFGQQQQQVNGSSIKFAPPQGSDTMMKSGVQQNINTRHQVSLDLLLLSILNTQ